MQSKPFLFFFVLLSLVIILLTRSLIQQQQIFTQHATGGVNTFQQLATFKGVPPAYTSSVGPGVTSGSQKYYLGYEYVGHTFDFVTIDPSNNYAATTYSSPLSTEYTASALAVGADNNIYIATKSTVNAHFFRFTTSPSELSDVGALPVDPASLTQQTYIWNMTVSPVDRRIYGCTYPSADLVSYAPTNPIQPILNLGTMDATNQYARYCVADPVYPYVYVGIGSVTAKIIAYNIQTQAITTLVTSPSSGFGNVYLGTDNHVYGFDPSGQRYVFSNGIATPTSTAPSIAATNVFSNGDRISITGNQITIHHPNQTQDIYSYTYQGNLLDIYRIGQGPDGNIYAGSTLPFYFNALSPDNPSEGLTNLGYFGGGEPYSMLPYQGKLAIGSYSSGAPLMMYDTTLPLNPNPYTNPNCANSTSPPNPLCIQTISNLASSGTPNDLRLQPLLAAPDGNLYSGSVGHYGQTNGPLIKWNPQSNTASAYYPFTNLGIASLAVGTHCQEVTTTNYCLIGGTTTATGTGATATATTAPLFIWDTTTNTMLRQFTIPNLTNVSLITDLITSPATNYVYGIANNSTGSYLFIFDPVTETFINGGTKLPFTQSNTIYNSAAIGSDGNIWGIFDTGIFMINLSTNTAQVVATAPETITAGFALVKNPINSDRIYFASHANIYAYTTDSYPPPANATLVFPHIYLHGIGVAGDNANPFPTLTEIPSPTMLHPTRTLTVQIFQQESDSDPIATVTGTITYQSTTGDFAGNIIWDNAMSGSYYLKILTDRYLRTSIPNIQQVTVGQAHILPTIALTVGDVDADNHLTIADYGILNDCADFTNLSILMTDPSAQFNSPACQAHKNEIQQMNGLPVNPVNADLDDNGMINEHDTTLFLRELSVSNGE